jgi:hypothetical protein
MMKKITIFLLLFFCTLQGQKITAQIPPPGTYIRDTTMTRFHGNWQWVSGIDTVQLYLATKKVYFPISGGFYMDCLVGWHIYKQGRTVIESSIQHSSNVNLRTFLGGSSPELPNKIENASFKDITKNKDVELFLTLNAAQNQLTWQLAMSRGMRVYAQGQIVPPGIYIAYTYSIDKIVVSGYIYQQSNNDEKDYHIPATIFLHFAGA